MKNINQKGQATLLAILIITTISIVTAVGVSSRQNTALKRTTYTKQTDQGFACANSAVDSALLCIRNKEDAGADATECKATNAQIAATDNSCVYSYTVSPHTPDADGFLNYSTIQRDTVLQIDTSEVNNLKISWTNNDAFLEISHVYLDSSDGTYKMEKFLHNRTGGGSAPADVDIDGFSDFPIGGISLQSATDSIVRIHPYFADALGVKISSTDSSFSSNTQGLKVKAKGISGSVIRNLEVIRTNPQLPAIFDYVLYSEEGSITK